MLNANKQEPKKKFLFLAKTGRYFEKMVIFFGVLKKTSWPKVKKNKRQKTCKFIGVYFLF